MHIGTAALCLALALATGGGDLGVQPREATRQEIQVPVLFMHHIDKTATGETVITPGKLDEISCLLDEEGYETIGFDDLVAYVDEGEALPDKPVILTFDDGYQSNLDYAAPILREREQRATIFVIGVSVGKDSYRDTGRPILPHFGWEDADEWRDVFDLGSHTYDMHQSEETDGPDFRMGVLPLPDEIPGQHFSLFRSDVYRSAQEMEKNWGKAPIAFAYPYGAYCAETEEVLRQQGFRVSLTTSAGRNAIVRDDPGSLFHLHRMEVFEDTSLTLIQAYLDMK